MTQTSKCCRRPVAFGRLIDPRFFKALSDPNRIALLVRLTRCGRPCSVSELNACCPVDLSVVSRHLAVLRDAGLLEARREGKEVFYSVQYDDIVRTLRGIADAIEACRPPCETTKEMIRE